MTVAQLSRVALEAIAHGQCDIVYARAAYRGAPLRDIRVDGGAAANNLLLQMQADISGVTLHRPRMLETTALGAAMLEGPGVGLWSGLAELRQAYTPDRSFNSKATRAEVDGAGALGRREVAGETGKAAGGGG